MTDLHSQAAEAELLAASAGVDGGLFLVREGRKPGTFALSWCHESKVSHTLVGRVNDGL